MSPRRVWSKLDRVLSTTGARALAWVVMVLLVAAGFGYVQEDQRRACEFGNEFRTVDLPAAIEDTNATLGEHLLGERDPVTNALVLGPDGQPILTLRDRAMIREYVADNRATLQRRFPPREC